MYSMYVFVTFTHQGLKKGGHKIEKGAKIKTHYM